VRATSLRPFDVNVAGIDWVPNYENTRFFLVLRLARPRHDELNQLLHLTNGCATRFNLPLLYEDGRPGRVSRIVDRSSAFHMSIAWQLQEPSMEQKKRIAGMNAALIQKSNIPFDAVKLKVGNVVKDIILSRDSNGKNHFVAG